MVPDLRRETPVQVRVSTDKPMLDSESSRMTAYCPVQGWQSSTNFIQLMQIHRDSAADPRGHMEQRKGPSHGLPKILDPPREPVPALRALGSKSVASAAHDVRGKFPGHVLGPPAQGNSMLVNSTRPILSLAR